ncbi:MAG: DUF3108 domain-containing protein [Bacteroidetes bacterium]|nr:DUF3108 domain-containing protein [Bacteroidota bacterium]
MKAFIHTTLVFLLSLLLFPSLTAQRTSGDLAESSRFRSIEQNAFGVGEELLFDVNYGFITAGQAMMTIPRYSWQKGRKCYEVQFFVRSKPFFDNLYYVRDRYETHIDVEALFPWRFSQRIREGNYKRDFSARFDHEAERVYTTEGDYPLPAFTQDVLSAFYYMRTYDFSRMRPGQRVELQNFYKDTTYTLTVVYHRKETVKVSAGTFRTVVLEPIMEEGGLFKASGRILVWLTDDERRLPVQVDAKIPIGSITSELIEYKGVSGPVRARIQ